MSGKNNTQKILITGATGYVGRRLTEHLLQRNDLSLRLLVRNCNKLSASVAERVDIVEGDTFISKALTSALEGVDTAFYLIHSMGSGKDFKELDRQSAENFRQAAVKAGVRRIIYLGGLGIKKSASNSAGA